MSIWLALARVEPASLTLAQAQAPHEAETLRPVINAVLAGFVLGFSLGAISGARGGAR